MVQVWVCPRCPESETPGHSQDIQILRIGDNLHAASYAMRANNFPDRKKLFDGKGLFDNFKNNPFFLFCRCCAQSPVDAGCVCMVDGEIQHLEAVKLWKKWVPWLGRWFMFGSVASTITLAPEICPNSTGMPAVGSDEPHRPKR